MFSKKESKSNNEVNSKVSDDMLKSLSKTNVKNSYKDYLIYFITLTFGICLLYTFNTIDKQFELFGENSLLAPYLSMAEGVIFGASIIISIIFAFLINYANQFLMKRRKREFGIYISLGMNKKDITKLMYKESIIIGTIALIVGVLVGIFAEQGLSILTTSMLGMESLKFKFSISIMALVKTGILFILVLWFINKFNKKTIQKYTLIELLKSDKKNEFVENRNTKINIVIFIVSLILIAIGYVILIRDSLSFKIIGLSLALLAIGTYLFFKSLSDFLIKLYTKRKSSYYKSLNMFVVSQITSRIKSMNLTITVICLLLTLSMTIIPSGLLLSKAIVNDLETATPYHATVSDRIYIYESNGKKLNSIKETLTQKGFPFKQLVSDYSEVKEYSLKNLTIEKLNADRYIKEKNLKVDLSEQIYLVGISDYNQARVQQGLSKMKLNDNEYILDSFNKDYKDIYENYLKSTDTININGFDLRKGSNKIESVSYRNSTVLSYTPTIVVPNKVLEGLEPSAIYLNVTYPKLTNQYDNEFWNQFYTYKGDNYDFSSQMVIRGEKLSMNIALSYIGIYLGIIFLITSGAVLALQQLVEQSSNIERYKLLKRLGVRRKYREKAIFTQVLILFLVPFIIALIHSIFINGAMYYMTKDLLTIDSIKNIIATIVIVVAVYGTYFVISYNDSKNNIID